MGVEHPLVAHDVEHDVVAVVVGVHGMKDVAGLDVEPGDVLGTAFALEQPDTCPVGRVPPVREAGAGHGRLEVEHDGKVVDDGEPLRERHVVDAHRTPDLDVDDLAHHAAGVDHRVLHELPHPQ